MSEIVLLILGFVVSLEINSVECGNKTSCFYIVHQNVNMDDNFFYANLMTLSVLSCAAECTQSDKCGTASYEMTSQMCYLATYDTTHEHTRANKFVTKAGYQTVSKIKYPVIQLYGPTGHKSLDSLEAATARCAEERYKIASPEDLLQARDMGLALCVCSWLSDGTIGLVLHRANSSCIGTYTDGITKCNIRKADVWCKIK